MNTQESKENFLNWLADKKNVRCEICNEIGADSPFEGMILCKGDFNTMVNLNMRLDFMWRYNKFPELAFADVPIDELF